MTRRPFNNEATQSERREVLNNDVTYHRFGLRDDSARGRFAKQQDKRAVTGAAAVPTYPTLPASSPWANWPDHGQPDWLNYDVNEMRPVGSPAEIEASIRQLEARERLLAEAVADVERGIAEAGEDIPAPGVSLLSPVETVSSPATSPAPSSIRRI